MEEMQNLYGSNMEDMTEAQCFLVKRRKYRRFPSGKDLSKNQTANFEFTEQTARKKA
jgi:hypothetical protein